MALLPWISRSWWDPWEYPSRVFDPFFGLRSYDSDFLPPTLYHGLVQPGLDIDSSSCLKSRLDSNLARPLERSPIGRMPIVREVLIFLIVRYLQRDDKMRAELDKCFYLLWSSIPDPTVTKQQLEEEKRLLFQRAPENLPTAALKFEMEVIVNTYDHMLFGTDKTPRTLSHLCRCFIRRALTLAGTLPHGVIQLRIPKNLQSYLLLTIPEDF
ncbi:hypothetical protein HNY73_017845 [Argiope bruennichi]|uniref:SOCS box domain-containing protein n=1 Tax=Argiope bruennichi TaxID=94029 RepID=A0A8T0EBB8_ARGBR|nr:hypothetical protein HNY73_017845 [Argiope bruennichi]